MTMGATTIWERWDSMLPTAASTRADDELQPLRAGAVADWMHRVIGGIAPLEPGYSRVLIAPQPGGGITWAQASLRTRHGMSPVITGGQEEVATGGQRAGRGHGCRSCPRRLERGLTAGQHNLG